mmetsp:Transcript_146887/g.258894  ORF Transcript_146887/g.258894 Transcript_146887/m.258894 type:complete len:406 (+) Transcript_146887:25-1242(+)
MRSPLFARSATLLTFALCFFAPQTGGSDLLRDADSPALLEGKLMRRQQSRALRSESVDFGAEVERHSEHEDTTPDSEKDCELPTPEVRGQFGLNVSVMGVTDFLNNGEAQDAISAAIAAYTHVVEDAVSCSFTKDDHASSDVQVKYVIAVAKGSPDDVYTRLMKRDEKAMLNGIWTNLMRYHLKWQVQFIPDSFSVTTNCPKSRPIGEQNPDETVTKSVTEEIMHHLHKKNSSNTHPANISEIKGVLSLRFETPFNTALAYGTQHAIERVLFKAAKLSDAGGTCEVLNLTNASSFLIEKAAASSHERKKIPGNGILKIDQSDHTRNEVQQRKNMLMEQSSLESQSVDAHFRINCAANRSLEVVDNLAAQTSWDMRELLRHEMEEGTILLNNFLVTGVSAYISDVG